MKRFKRLHVTLGILQGALLAGLWTSQVHENVWNAVGQIAAS